MVAGLAISQAETNRQFKEQMAALSAAQARTDAQIASVNKQMGGLSSSLGSSTEEFFFNTLLAKPMVGGVRFDRVMTNVLCGSGGHRAEFDIVLINGSSVALIEVKHKTDVDDLEQVQTIVDRYRLFFPEHQNFVIYAGIAGFTVPDKVVQAAHERGFFVLKRKGDLMETDTAAMRAF